MFITWTDSTTKKRGSNILFHPLKVKRKYSRRKYKEKPKKDMYKNKDAPRKVDEHNKRYE